MLAPIAGRMTGFSHINFPAHDFLLCHSKAMQHADFLHLFLTSFEYRSMKGIALLENLTQEILFLDLFVDYCNLIWGNWILATFYFIHRLFRRRKSKNALANGNAVWLKSSATMQRTVMIALWNTRVIKKNVYQQSIADKDISSSLTIDTTSLSTIWYWTVRDR